MHSAQKNVESLSTPTASFAEIFNGLFPIGSMNGHIKFKVRSSTHSWDNRGYSKIGHSLDTPALPFLRNFCTAFVRMDHVNESAKFEVRSLTHSWENKGTQKFGQSPDTPTLPFLSYF